MAWRLAGDVRQDTVHTAPAEQFRRFAAALGAGALAAGLAGCAAFPERELADRSLITRFINQEIVRSDFASELAFAYQARTADELAFDSDWSDAVSYFRRGRAALLGEAVAPWDPADFDLEDRADLIEARRLTLMGVGAFQSTRPAECAETVARYDDWLQAVAEGVSDQTAVNHDAAAWSAAYSACVGDLAVQTGGPFELPRLGASGDAVDAMMEAFSAPEPSVY